MTAWVLMLELYQSAVISNCVDGDLLSPMPSYLFEICYGVDVVKSCLNDAKQLCLTVAANIFLVQSYLNPVSTAIIRFYYLMFHCHMSQRLLRFYITKLQRRCSKFFPLHSEFHAQPSPTLVIA